jgi:hypothetical protein
LNAGRETKLWKFPLDTDKTEQRYEWPYVVQFLDLQMQDSTPVLWALVYADAPKRTYKIMRFLTGDTVYGTTCHLGTVTRFGDVLHYFSGGPGL